jgi:hypothetical protein
VTATSPRIVQIASTWAPGDDEVGLDATDQVFALDDAGRIWKGDTDSTPERDDAWCRLEALPTWSQVDQIAVTAAPRDRQRDSGAQERLFALCRDGSVWLKILPVLYREHAWVRLPDILPERVITQISVAWAPYQGQQGAAYTPLTNSADRLFALCRDGSVWLFRPFAAWEGEPDTETLPRWDRLPGLPSDC